MAKMKSRGVDAVEDQFDLHGRMWEEYVEWCETGYVVRDAEGFASYLSTEATPKGFEIWKQDMGYMVDEVDD
jgi:hypothetical protein